MKRTYIRDNRSSLSVKPRIFDFIIYDDGTEEIEVKDGKVRKTILLSDLLEQIKIAKNNTRCTTEQVSR